MGDWFERAKRWQPIIMSFIVVFAVIEGGITSYLTAKNNNGDKWPDNSYRDRVKLLMFCSWWTTFMSSLYMIFFFWFPTSWVTSVLSHTVYIWMTWVFWLSGAASFTQAMGGGKRCGHTTLVYCSKYVATEAFAWIEWILLCFYLILMFFMVGTSILRGERINTPIAMHV